MSFATPEKAAETPASTQSSLPLGGKLESLHYGFGERDVIAIVEMPDNVAMSALALAVSGSGTVRARTTPLLTVEETDQALSKKV